MNSLSSKVDALERLHDDVPAVPLINVGKGLDKLYEGLRIAGWEGWKD